MNIASIVLTEDSTMPGRGYSYRRISANGKQARGGGLDRQGDGWAEAMCKARGWFLDDTYSFTDKGKSGYHGHNLKATAGLGRFLAAVKHGTITRGSILLIESLDRLSREEVGDAFDLVRGLLKAGITIVTRQPEREYAPGCENNMLTILEWLFIAARAHEESEMKSFRASQAWQADHQRAHARHTMKHSRTPAWIAKTPSGYTLIPQLASIVQRIARMAREGHGCGSIATILNKEGLTSLTRKGHWSGQAINQLLHSRTLIGEYQPRHRINGKMVNNGSPIPAYYPAVLSEDEWLATSAARTNRRHRSGRPAVSTLNLFTALITDAQTRKKMSLQAATTHAGKKIVYLSPGNLASCARARYDHVEAAVLDTLALLQPADVLDRPADADRREDQISKLTARLIALDHRQQQLTVACADPDQDADTLLPVLRQVGNDKADTAKQLETLKLESRSGRAEALTVCQTLRELRDAATGDERAELERRIKAALPSVVTEIWLKCQKITRKAQIVHLWVYLRNGQRRYQRIMPEHGKCYGVEPWQLANEDPRGQ